MLERSAGTCSDEETFDLDQQEVERKYKKLQTVYHPDKYANASEVTSVPLQTSYAQAAHEGFFAERSCLTRGQRLRLS